MKLQCVKSLSTSFGRTWIVLLLNVCLVLSLFNPSKNDLTAQPKPISYSILTLNTTVVWEGGAPQCLTCSASPETGSRGAITEPSFACSDEVWEHSSGDWRNGSKLFVDPLVKHVGRGQAKQYLLTQATVFVYGLFDCRESWKQNPTKFNMYLANELITTVQHQKAEQQPCMCGNCVDLFTYSTRERSSGWPNYNYGDINEIRIEVERNMICLSRIKIMLTYFEVSSDQSKFVHDNPQAMIRDFILVSAITAGAIFMIVGAMLGVRYVRKQSDDPLNSSINHADLERNGKAVKTGKAPLFHIRGEEIIVGPRIGKGSYGEVHRARWRGIDVAVKKLPFYLLDNKEFMRDFHQEATIMSSLRHPNILQFLGSCVLDKDICILTEYMARGSVYRLLHDESFVLPYRMIKRWAIDAARGILYLHQSNPQILHRDLKSHNMLVDDTYKVKLCDFGLSKVVEEACHLTMTSCGTAAWAAPEILKNQRYTEKADVYSYGICLWEFWTRKDPYEGMPTFQIIFAVGTEGLRPVIPESCPRDYSQLITDCLEPDPSKRPSVQDILYRLQNLQEFD